jgi:hypothetical protein
MEEISKEIIEIDDKKFYMVLYKLYNSFLFLLSDQKEMGIGNVTLSSPPLFKGAKAISTSYKLFGVDSEFISKAIAEKLSRKVNEPVLILTFLKEKIKENKTIKKLIEIINVIFKNVFEERIKKGED